jgi:hypothetical protein
VLGDDRHGNKAVIGFQYGGGRQGGLPIAGDWCCFQLNGLSGLRFNGDRWVIGPIDRRPMHLLSTVEVSAA